MHKLDELLKYYQPTKFIVASDTYNDEFETPVLTAGKSFLLGYTNEEGGIFSELPAIIFDDFTTSFHYVDFPFKVKSSAMKILVPRNDKVDLKYIFYQMKGLRIDTALHKRYWISKFSQLKMELPPLETQKRIAQILDDANALRQKTEKLLEEYDDLAQSIFLDMFGDPVTNPKGWNIEKLKSVTTKIGSGSTPKGGKESYKDEGISLIRSLNIHDNLFKYKDLAFIDDSQADKLKNVIIEEYDVLFNITGASVARCAIVPSEVLPARVNQHVAILRPDSAVLDSAFLMHLMISPNSKLKLLGVSSQGGATREAITKDQLENFDTIIPDIEIQRQFARKIKSIEKQKELAKEELQESEDLFNCLLQKAFIGELETTKTEAL